MPLHSHLKTAIARLRPAGIARLLRVCGLLLPLALTLLLSACGGVNARDTLNPAGDAAAISAWFFWLYMIVDVVIFIIVGGGFVYAIARFRKKPGDDDTPNLELHGNAKLELIWTIIPTLVILVLTTITIAGVFEISADPSKEQNLLEIDVIGKQWWWEYDYKQHGFSTANEMHVEEEQRVLLNLTSADVMHAFWVPRISGKRDATPGRTYPLSFKAYAVNGEVTEFLGQCAELCGASHARMGIKLFVHPKTGENSFANWIKTQQAQAREPVSPLEEQGKQVFKTKGCVACHSISGVAELAQRSRTTGPDLTHVGSRTSIVANSLPNSVENLAKWVKDPQSIKEAALMSNLGLTLEESNAVATYLFSLK